MMAAMASLKGPRHGGMQKKLGKKKCTVLNVSRDVYDIFDMTKFTELMNIEKKLREISVEGAEIVGRGRSSTVYRIDPETIVKLYTAGVPLAKIKQEIDLAKKAFVAGIPTPISYDLVRCGEAYGVVFEMLGDADTVGHSLTSHMDQFDVITRKFVDTYKIVHQADIKDMGGFSSLKDVWHTWADGMNSPDGFNDEETAMLHKLIDAVPERSTMVHCDYHAGNVMYQKGEIVVIDMADIGYGHPIFDLAGNAFHARYSGSETRQKVHGMNQENMLRFYNTLLSMESLVAFSGLFGGLVAGVLIVWAVCALAILLFGRLSPVPAIKKIAGLSPLIFTVSSSHARLPFVLKFCAEKLGIDGKLAAFSIPVGGKFK